MRSVASCALTQSTKTDTSNNTFVCPNFTAAKLKQLFLLNSFKHKNLR